MANDIVKANGTGLNKLEFDKDTIALIKAQIAPDATDNELSLFLYQCQRTGLDPLTRQIYCIHRKSGNKSKMTVQTSIDGFRVIAERSGEYGGQDEPVFGEPLSFRYPVYEWQGGQKIIKEWKEKKVPSCAKVAVYKFKGGQRYQVAVGVAYWEEYYPGHGQGDMWLKMPHTMLSKVAEAVALRKSFPHDLSGLYTSDEMSQSETTEDGVVTDVTTGTSNSGQGEKPTVITQPAGQKKGGSKKEEKPEEPKQDAPPPPPAGKKWVSEKAFNDAMARIKGGEWEVVKKMGEAFAFNESQQTALKEVVDNIFGEAVEKIEKGEGSLVAKLRDSLPLSKEQQDRLAALTGDDLPF